MRHAALFCDEIHMLNSRAINELANPFAEPIVKLVWGYRVSKLNLSREVII